MESEISQASTEFRSTGRISTTRTRPSTVARPGWCMEPIGLTPGGGIGRSYPPAPGSGSDSCGLPPGRRREPRGWRPARFVVLRRCRGRDTGRHFLLDRRDLVRGGRRTAAVGAPPALAPSAVARSVAAASVRLRRWPAAASAAARKRSAAVRTPVDPVPASPAAWRSCSTRIRFCTSNGMMVAAAFGTRLTTPAILSAVRSCSSLPSSGEKLRLGRIAVTWVPGCSASWLTRSPAPGSACGPGSR